MTANGVTGGDPNKVSTTGGTVTGTLDLAAASNPLQIPHGAQAGYVWTDTDNTGNGSWQPAPGGTPATTVQSGTSYGTATAVGVLGSFAREDHQHGTPSLASAAPATTLGIGTAAATGTATLPARADHVHPTAAAGVPGSSAVGDAATTGSASTFAASDHKHGREGFGTVAAQTAYGAASANGVATTVAHSDHTHGTPALTTTAPATTLGIGTAAALGSATLPALADHVHPVAAAGAPTASAVGDASVTGVASTFAASDHRHARETFGTPGSSAVGDVAAAGAAATVARSDHTHGREAFGAVSALNAFGTASSNGSAATISHSDHVHGAPALPVGSTSVSGIVQIDGTATDYQPVGPAAAGAVGKVADAGHVHPYQPWQFSPFAYGAKGDGQASATGSVTAGSGVVTIGESKFNAGTDVGKLIMVKYAASAQGSSGQSTAVGTITAVNSSTQVTTNLTAAVSGAALTVLWATDDTAAIQSAINAANTYALSHLMGEVFFPAPSGLFYGVGGALKFSDGTNSVFNSQLTIPVNGEQNPGVTLVLRGVGDSGQSRYWNQDFPAFNASTLVSFGVFVSQADQQSSNTHSINNGGNPAVVGGPTGKFNYGVLQGSNTTPTYSNTCLVLQDLTILTSHSNSGWTYSAVNAFGLARFHAKNFSYGTTGVVQFYKNSPGLGDFNNVTLLSGGASVGVLMPSNGNNASNYLQNVVCNGGYTYALFATEHTVGNDVTLLYSWSGLCPVGNYSDSASGGTVSALHASEFDQACIESCTYHVNIIGAGASSIGPIVHAVIDTEGTLQFRDNPNNGTGLNAASGEIRLCGSPSTVNLTFATGLRIIKEQNLPGVPSSGIPALSANTAVMNSLWRPATVYLVGGANLTTIQVSRLAGGAAAPAVSTVADFTAAGTISAPFPVRLGPGQWIKINTSSGTTIPTATWVLD